MGHPAISFAATIAAAYAIALAIYPALRRGGAWSVTVVAAACAAILGGLLIISPEFRIHRAIAAVFCVDLFFRLVDFTRQNHTWGRHSCLPGDPADKNVRPTGHEKAIGWPRYLHFLIPFPLLLVIFGQKERRRWPPARPSLELSRVILGSIGVTAGFILVFAAERSYALQSSFLLDHVAKLFIFVLTLESLAQALCGLERLAGYDTTPIIDRAFLSRTPAEFWRRWNNRVQPWLYWNVFLPSGGRRAPVRGIWATFLASALLHEGAFAIATSEPTGYQFIFFLIQAPAVMASPALDRLARASPLAGAAVAHAATWLWMAATSIFFFHGVDRIFPFTYASQSPLP